MIDLEHIQELHDDRGGYFLAGIDEVGRGPLAGPVVAACACLMVDEDCEKDRIFQYLQELGEWGITDSKKLVPKKRKAILNELGIECKKISPLKLYTLGGKKNFQLNVSVAEISHTQIDQLNILNAALLAMKNSYEAHRVFRCRGTVLIDGNKKAFGDSEKINVLPIVKGDQKSWMIGLASIVAKEYRDELMIDLSKKYPGYGLESHSGYPTKSHKEAIEKLGVSEIHRKSFKGVKEHI